LIVEADSFEFHGTRAAFERDRRRDQLLRKAGWMAVRITWRQLNERPEEVVAAMGWLRCSSQPLVPPIHRTCST
jgi:very-short-patch-repair endonuclease